LSKNSTFRSGDFSNPVHSEGDVDLSEIGAAGRQTSEALPAAPKTGKKRAPPPKLEASAETVMALETGNVENLTRLSVSIKRCSFFSSALISDFLAQKIIEFSFLEKKIV